MNFFKIQEELDEYKEQMPDKLYLQISNLLLDLFKTKEQIDKYVDDNNLVVEYFKVCDKYTKLVAKYKIAKYTNNKLKEKYEVEKYANKKMLRGSFGMMCGGLLCLYTIFITKF